MSRNKPTAERMTTAEALRLGADSTVEELNYCYHLYSAYYNNRQRIGCIGSHRWELMCLLSLFYRVGRIQGIRDERTRRKAVAA